MILFVVLIVAGREDLGFKGIGLCLLIVAGLTIGGPLLHIPSYVLIPLMTLMDIVLLLVIFGRDFRIW
jgi:hypothetical protein